MGGEGRHLPFLLGDLHDTFRLWFVPLRVCQYMRQLDLSLVLGSFLNDSQFNDLIHAIYNIDWEEVPASHACRGSRRNDFSPGRLDNASDYVLYDPFLRFIIDERTERSRADTIRVQYLDVPHRFVFVEDASVDHKIDNQCNTQIVDDVSAPVFVYTSMSDVSQPVPLLIAWILNYIPFVRS